MNHMLLKGIVMVVIAW